LFFVFLPCSIFTLAIKINLWIIEHLSAQSRLDQRGGLCCFFCCFFIFFIFPLFPTCSLYVPFKFSTGSLKFPRVFPIAPCFNPMCFAQSPPLLAYIAGPKGEALHLSIESSI
jgi:hypothetical protein